MAWGARGEGRGRSGREARAERLTKAARLGIRGLHREWRAGELRVLALALIIAVTSIASVGLFANRLDAAMHRQASELLGADLVVRSPEPIPQDLVDAARRRGLETARTLTFRSVLTHGERFQLVAVKAVSPGYPLRGMLRVASEPFGTDQATRRIPESGTVWLDSRLASILGLASGDGLRLGAAALRVSRILTDEPDRGGELFNIAPHLLMNLSDVPATELVAPGSRVRHRLLVAGSRQDISAFRAQLGGALAPHEEVRDVRDGRPEMRRALARSQQFLGLAALLSVFIGVAAIAIAARRYSQRHVDEAALLRCLGASRGVIVGAYAARLIALGLLASLLGAALGYAAQAGLAALIGELVLVDLPPPSWQPAALALLAGLLALATFALPPVIGLRAVAPARVLQRAPEALRLGGGVGYAPGAAVLVALVFWQAEDPRLAGYVVGGGLATLAVLSAAAWLVVRSLERFRSRVGVAWRFGLASIGRRPVGSLVQIVAFGLGVMALLLLTFVRTDLLEGWRRGLPRDAPNFFLVNVQPREVPALRRFLAARGHQGTVLHPMVRGRLTAIDGQRVSPDAYDSRRARHLAAHDFNLSWTRSLPPDNDIVAGRWWGPDGGERSELSVERELAETLGIELGDALTFDIAGEPLRATVTSLRSVQWDSFRPNFFVLAPPGTLDGYPATYITSLHVPPDDTHVLAALVDAFPSVTVVDVDALLSRIREIMDRAALGVEYVFVFTLLAGLTVLYAGVQSTLDERRFEAALARALGAERRQLLAALAAEFAALGLVAGLVASLGAALIGATLARRIFEIPYHTDPWMWLAGALAGVLGIGIAGLLGTRRVLDEPPSRTLAAV